LSGATTLHLSPQDVWERQKDQATYVPEAYEADGFIHCTNDDDNMLKVANLFYQGDPREFVVLTLTVDSIKSEVKYEDPDQIYPHIYGPLNTDAVAGVRSVNRTSEGRFEGFSHSE
jgi:uncharacterized protein (DUF952 family)